MFKWMSGGTFNAQKHQLVNMGVWSQLKEDNTCQNMALWFVSRSITHKRNELILCLYSAWEKPGKCWRSDSGQTLGTEVLPQLGNSGTDWRRTPMKIMESHQLRLRTNWTSICQVSVHLSLGYCLDTSSFFRLYFPWFQSGSRKVTSWIPQRWFLI